MIAPLGYAVHDTALPVSCIHNPIIIFVNMSYKILHIFLWWYKNIFTTVPNRSKSCISLVYELYGTSCQNK